MYLNSIFLPILTDFISFSLSVSIIMILTLYAILIFTTVYQLCFLPIRFWNHLKNWRMIVLANSFFQLFISRARRRQKTLLAKGKKLEFNPEAGCLKKTMRNGFGIVLVLKTVLYM